MQRRRGGHLVPDVRGQISLIEQFLNAPLEGSARRAGDARCGVYAFYDFDGAAIYVGQTREQLRVRIQRHLTNRRTDAVAMKVLDPMEVAEIEVWPFWDLETRPPDMAERDWRVLVQPRLDSAEWTVYNMLRERQGNIIDILNEKLPPRSRLIDLPRSHRASIVPEESRERLYHPDERIARRAATIAALALIVKERDVSLGLRNTLIVQADRLLRLAQKRFDELRGETPNAEAELVGSEDEGERHGG